MNPDFNLIEPSRRAACALDDAMMTRRQWERENRRPRGLTAREAFLALRFEAMVIWVAGENLCAGVSLDSADLERIGIAMRRINEVVEEAAS